MMDFTKILADTEKRFRDRTPIRTDQKEKIEAGLPLQADTPERVEKRLKRLGFDDATAKGLVDSTLPAIPVPLDGQERILDANDLVSVNFLERGAIAARSVGRIRVRSTNGQSGFGTGFLVSPRLLLTNNHVLPNADIAALSRVEFDYQDGVDGNLKQPIVFNLQPEVLFLTNVALDYSLVAVNPTAQGGAALSSFGWHSLIEAEGKIIVSEWVNIIQHPDGDPKQVAVRGNKLVDALPDFLHYETDTAPGSSGSPVFNDQWEVVALHHSGVPRRDANGNILNIEGQPWTKEQGEHRIAWIANEGVRISRIIKHIKSQTVAPTAQELIRGMLNGQPVASVQEMAVAQPMSDQPSTSIATPQPSINPQNDGTVTWTLPLEVSVRLGQPTIQTESSSRNSVPSIVDTHPASVSKPSLAPDSPAVSAFAAAIDQEKGPLQNLQDVA